MGRTSIGAWLMAIGLALAIPSGLALAILLRTGQAPNPTEIEALALLASGAIFVIAIVVFLVGLAAYVILPALDRDRARQDYGSHITVLACLALAIIVSLVLQFFYVFVRASFEPGLFADGFTFGLARGARQMLDPWGLLVAIVTLELSLLAIVWVRIIRPGVITWEQMGFTGENLGKKTLYGLATGAAIFLAAAIVELTLRQFGLEQTQMQLFSSIKRASPLEFALVVLAGGPLAAFAEETFFRGYVFHAYWKKKGLWQAYLFSSLIFGIVHLNLPAFLPIFVIGLVLAFVYSRTQSVIPVMIGHGINNTIAFVALYFVVSSGTVQ